MITDDLTDLLERAVLGITEPWQVGLPARVEAFDAATRTCSVQPLIQARDEAGEPLSRPVITQVPVFYPDNGAFELVWDLVPDENVWLLGSSRSLEEWLTEGGEVTPTSARRMRLTDMVCLPLRPTPNAEQATPAGKLQIRITAAGGITIERDGVDLLAVLSELAGALFTYTCLDGSPLQIAPPGGRTFEAMQTDIDAVRG